MDHCTQIGTCVENSLLFVFKIFIYLFLAVLGLCFCAWAFSSCGKQGLLSGCCVLASHCSVFCCRIQVLGAWTSVVVACWLQSVGSVVVEQRLSCPAACGIFPDQGLNQCPLHCKMDSELLGHQGIPIQRILSNFFFQVLL